ncbi:MAG: ATP-grasp domain-containing protein [Hydrogenibacillus schlegelii]|uniref:ATP-grasp domain-containing protein n=1 Tax=Hydrogenibacillus schlegelii TaxID=1484 RepID=A0A947D4L9_HYDSH|nr:ATP-grasp domain-containing protein [Hydrogenibacillus schlegelii]
MAAAKRSATTPRAFPPAVQRVVLPPYEFEHLDAEAVAALAESVPVPQGTALLRLAQHRALEKAALSAGGFPVAPYAAIARPEDWPAALRTVGLPALLKTTTGGYDGKAERPPTPPPPPARRRPASF